MHNKTLLRLPEVINQTQLSRSSIYAAIQKGTFPPPVRVGKRAVRWRPEDIEVWRSQLGSTLPPPFISDR